MSGGNVTDQADLFAAPAPGSELLEDRSWLTSASSPFVELSRCGRFSVVEYPFTDPRRFAAFRRRTNARGQWEPPTLVGGFDSREAARKACRDFARAET